MKYLVIGKNPTSGALEWNIVDSREKAAKFIEINYNTIIQRCNYSSTELHRHILVVEIEPNYEFLALDITKPVNLKIELKG